MKGRREFQFCRNEFFKAYMNATGEFWSSGLDDRIVETNLWAGKHLPRWRFSTLEERRDWILGQLSRDNAVMPLSLSGKLALPPGSSFAVAALKLKHVNQEQAE